MEEPVRSASSERSDQGAGPRVVQWRMGGPVVSGDKRGRELGFPTANLRCDAGDCPPFGVYAARVDGRPAAVSVGIRPTFGEGLEPLLEAHILDFSGDLYGQEVTVELFEFIRPEERFTDIAALVRRIRDDVDEVRRLEREHTIPR